MLFAGKCATLRHLTCLGFLINPWLQPLAACRRGLFDRLYLRLRWLVSRVMRLADPRTYGSQNPGATNVLRSGNKAAAGARPCFSMRSKAGCLYGLVAHMAPASAWAREPWPWWRLAGALRAMSGRCFFASRRQGRGHLQRECCLA
jgi:hypothetical protein